MRWLNARVGSDTPQREADRFEPREWEEYFGGLTPEQRRAASARLCRRVIGDAALPVEAIEQAIAALTDGQHGRALLEAVQAVAERSEGEYESLVGDDESKLGGSDPVVAAAFVRARAATALLCALQGVLCCMAYEGWFVLNDLDEVRRLVGMPRPKP